MYNKGLHENAHFDISIPLCHRFLMNLFTGYSKVLLLLTLNRRLSSPLLVCGESIAVLVYVDGNSPNGQSLSLLIRMKPMFVGLLSQTL